MSTEALLNERQRTHGSFAENAYYGQTLRLLFRQSQGWLGMSAIQQEALDMIACKLSRICSGQASYDDHWRDIAGYATLAIETTRGSYDDHQLEADVNGVAITGP